MDNDRHTDGFQILHRPVEYRQVIAPAEIPALSGWIVCKPSSTHTGLSDSAPPIAQNIRPSTVRLVAIDKITTSSGAMAA